MKDLTSKCVIVWCTQEAEYKSPASLCKKHYDEIGDLLRADRCQWCDSPAVAKGDDGTLSCGQGQGDGLEHHSDVGVQYTALSPDGIGWERIR